MPDLHPEALPAPQRKLLDKLAKNSSFLAGWGYYLAGGTALALHLGHRRSLDFDFFSTQKALAEKTLEWLRTFAAVTVRDTDQDTLHAEADVIKVSFIGAYRYKLIEPTVEYNGLKLAGLVDIGLMKLLALTHRATLRDYLDMAALVRGPVRLQRLLEAGREKYGPETNPMLFLRALVTWTDIDEEMPVLVDTSLKKDWKGILQKAVKSVAG